MIDFSFNIVNPFGNFDEQKIVWRLFKADLPFNNITIYKHKPNIIYLSCAITLENAYLEIGLFGYSLLLDKS